MSDSISTTRELFSARFTDSVSLAFDSLPFRALFLAVLKSLHSLFIWPFRRHQKQRLLSSSLVSSLVFLSFAFLFQLDLLPLPLPDLLPLGFVPSLAKLAVLGGLGSP